MEAAGAKIPSDARVDRAPLYIDNAIYRRSAYGGSHPLNIARTETVTALCREMGWLPDEAYRESGAANIETLARFHDRAYLGALQNADRTGRVERNIRERFNFGTMENPLFAGVFERAATTVGGSILAAELALAGNVAYHPAGGTHHGRSERASGFCYFNDPVFCLLTFLDAGLDRVLYVDLDAHHGDGVEHAFRSDRRVYLASIHESGRWPNSGMTACSGDGRIVNLATPGGLNDAEFRYLIDAVMLPFAITSEAQAMVITCGADALDGDPLSTMRLNNTSLWDAVERLIQTVPTAVVLGGGGYNPWTVARCWSGLWARLAGFEIPEILPGNARDLLSALESDLIDDDDIVDTWTSRIADPVNDAAIRPELFEIAAYVTTRRPASMAGSDR